MVYGNGFAGMVFGLAYRVWHGIYYGLACLALYMVWPGKHGMEYDMALQA